MPFMEGMTESQKANNQQREGINMMLFMFLEMQKDIAYCKLNETTRIVIKGLIRQLSDMQYGDIWYIMKTGYSPY